MKINIVFAERVVELSEFKNRHEKIKALVSNWRYVALVSIGLLTVKVAAEQIVMLVKR